MTCTCESCVRACNTCPGWFSPDQVQKVAQHLNMTVSHLFAKCLVAIESSYHSNVLIMAPRKMINQPGTLVPYGDRWEIGQCTFLHNERCQIHPVKPHECNAVVCASDKTAVTENNPRSDLSKLWNNATHQIQIKRLLDLNKNSKPYIPPFLSRRRFSVPSVGILTNSCPSGNLTGRLPQASHIHSLCPGHSPRPGHIFKSMRSHL